MHNVPREVVVDAEYAACYFFDDPSRPGLYVPTVGGGTIYLSELLQEMDVIDRLQQQEGQHLHDI